MYIYIYIYIAPQRLADERDALPTAPIVEAQDRQVLQQGKLEGARERRHHACVQAAVARRQVREAAQVRKRRGQRAQAQQPPQQARVQRLQRADALGERGEARAVAEDQRLQLRERAYVGQRGEPREVGELEVLELGEAREKVRGQRGDAAAGLEVQDAQRTEVDEPRRQRGVPDAEAQFVQL